MEFYIVNEIDRPYERLVTALIPGKGLRYIHPDLADFPFLAYHEDTATSLRAFGFEWIKKGDVYTFHKVRPEVAKYRNGDPRHWQGRPTFSLLVKEDVLTRE